MNSELTVRLSIQSFSKEAKELIFKTIEETGIIKVNDLISILDVKTDCYIINVNMVEDRLNGKMVKIEARS